MPEVQTQCHRRDGRSSGRRRASATARRLGEIVEQAVPEAGDKSILKPHANNRYGLPERLVEQSPLFRVSLVQVGVLAPEHVYDKPLRIIPFIKETGALSEDVFVPAR